MNIKKGLEVVWPELSNFVSSNLKDSFGDDWRTEAAEALCPEDSASGVLADSLETVDLLRLVDLFWDNLFGYVFPNYKEPYRDFVGNLIGFCEKNASGAASEEDMATAASSLVSLSEFFGENVKDRVEKCLNEPETEEAESDMEPEEGAAAGYAGNRDVAEPSDDDSDDDWIDYAPEIPNADESDDGDPEPTNYYDDDFVRKLKDCFSGLVVFKDSKNSSVITSSKLPSYLRDYVLALHQDPDDGSWDSDEVGDFIRKYIPDRNEFKSMLNRMMTRGDSVSIIARISSSIDIKSGRHAFMLPDYNLSAHDTLIEDYAWGKYGESLLSSDEKWGRIKLSYSPPSDEKRKDGRVLLDFFEDFVGFEFDLDEFREIRRSFSIDEWIDIILGAIDYNPVGFSSKKRKLAMLNRLLPFVQNNLHLIELAPKGTGKSYFFGKLSRFGWITSGGGFSRAKLFYDYSTKRDGLIKGRDYVALDEIQTIRFSDKEEMRGAMKTYMEGGIFKCNDGREIKSNAGIVLLGNISKERMNVKLNMFKELNEVFHESALIDRFKGFIEGWNIPEVSVGMKVCGWALNTEWFTSILNRLRSEICYRKVVEELLILESQGAYNRHDMAVRDLAEAFLKLLFPNVREPGDISPEDFRDYCFRPAFRMREIIWRQLCILDPKEFKRKEKRMPRYRIRGLEA